MERLTESKPKTNADRIRSMTDEELAEFITGSSEFDCADYCDSFAQGCAFKCGKKEREIALKWLQSEADRRKTKLHEADRKRIFYGV